MFGFDEDTSVELLENLGIDSSYDGISFEALRVGNSRYVKDLRVNVNIVLDTDHLTKKEAALLAISIAANDKNKALIEVFRTKATELEATNEEIAEAVACASLLASNNITYRFRHFLNKEKYNKAPMKIKMNIMARPVLGKEFFELMSLVISAVNGCEMCVRSHEDSLLKLGVSEDKVWDSIRLSGVITSLSKVIY